MSIDTAVNTDPCPAVKILLIFVEKHYDFSNICCGTFFTHSKAETEAVMNVLAGLYFDLAWVS